MLTRDHLPILREVRSRLDAGDEKFICYALSNIATKNPRRFDRCEQIRRHIMAEITPYSLFSTWLTSEMFPGTNGYDLTEPYHFGYWEDDGVMLLARLAWIDKLIRDIEKC